MFRKTIFWLLPVILIPLAVMLVMQYRFLRTLQTRTVDAERNWLRSAAETVALEIEWYYRTAAAKALTIPQSAVTDQAKLMEHIRQNPVRGAKTYFLVQFRGAFAPRYDLYDATGWEKTIGEDELQAIKLATVSWHVVHKYGTSVAPPTVTVDERDAHNRVMLRAVTDSKMRVTGVTGIVLDEALAKASMMVIGKQALRRNANMISVRVGDRFPAAPRGDFTTRPLAFAFTDWKAGVRGVCGTPEQIAAYNFKMNSLYTGGGAVVLFIALILSVQAIARQSRLSQMKSDFVSNVSHELRTPLASIRVFGEYMRLGRVYRDEKIREYGEYIEAESRRLTQLINNILDFSKIESAEKKYQFVESDLAELVRQTVGAFAMPLREQGFRVDYEGPSEPLPAVIDKDAMAQVVVNLLDNAVKYSKERKEIGVHVGRDGDELQISVRDRGIGIPASEQKKIFEKFYRVGSGLVHDVKGSGLGLAIVAHVVKAHGGRVDVQSEPGEGSTFTITLPGGAAVPSPAHIEEYA